jgi:lysophospholipase L1-like esterase
MNYKAAKLTEAVLASAVFLAIFAFASATSCATGFSDINRKHWAYEDIGILSASEIITGYPDGSFLPDNPVERQEIAVIMARLANMTGMPAIPATPTYVDAPRQLWSYTSIEAAKAYFPGYHNRDGTQLFRPSALATRGEVITALVSFNDYNILAADLGKLSRFTDSGGLNPKLRIYAALAIEEKIITGYSDNTLRLNEPITRAETCVMLVNALSGNERVKLAEPPAARQLYVPEASSGFYDRFFDDAVFVGDSVTMGLRNFALYQRGKNVAALGRASFLAEVSYNLRVSSRDEFISSGVNLSYAGEKMPVQDIIRLLGAKKVFIMLGLNDGVANDPSTGVARYGHTLDNVLKMNPGVDIYVELCTPIAKSGETARVNNVNVNAFNEALKALCAERGIEWVDTNSPFKSAGGYMRDDYTSDRYVHFNNSGAAAWIGALNGFARDKYVNGEWNGDGQAPEGFDGKYVDID